MRLAVGKFGRFYGCSNFKVTGCRGGVSASNDGRPLAQPADAYTRRLRKQLVTHIENLAFEQRQAALRYLRDPIGSLNATRCEEALTALGAPIAQRKTIWDRLKEE